VPIDTLTPDNQAAIAGVLAGIINGPTGFNMPLATVSGNKVTLKGDALIEFIGGVTAVRVSATDAVYPRAPQAPAAALFAEAKSDLGTGTIEATFRADGDFGTAVNLSITSVDFGGPASPFVMTRGSDISVVVNSFAAQPTTLQELIDAINNDSRASALVTASRRSFDVPTTDIGSGVASLTGGAVQLRLTGQGSSFDTATSLGQLDLEENQNQRLSTTIDAQTFAYDFPGTPDEPGHRDLPVEAGSGYDQHINPAFGEDSVSGVRTVYYNFRSAYGSDPQGNTLSNVISDNQKQRTREALELWARYLGVQFVETANAGVTIATGDLRSLNSAAPDVRTVPNGLVRVDPTYSKSLLVLDTNTSWNDSFGQSYFQSVMRGVGYMLGLGSSPELPVSGEPVYPSVNDVVHGQLLHRPDSNDIDMYRFTVDLEPGKTGLFTAETFAERLTDSSLLDTVVRLYRETPSVAAS
ncbi:MAG TPA: hypothetical protein PLV92_24015, partial [Pirellulaceae bacterium]|nr:hypothetical protein [Pirellulaceae bacterium]